MEFLFQISGSLILLILTVGFSVAGFYSPAFLRRMVFHPFSVVKEKQIYRILSGGLVHGNVGHLVLNLLVFYFFAFPLNHQIGNVQFLVIYLVSLAGSHVSALFKHKAHEEYYSLGASGAIAGILFAFILFNPDARISLLFIPVGIPAPIFALIYMAYSLLQARRKQSHINHEAHLWGAVTGFITAFLLNWNVFIFRLWEILGR